MRSHRLRTARRAFTLTEALVATGLLIVVFSLAGSVFRITLDGSAQLKAQNEIDRAIRLFKNQLANELANIDPESSILAIQGNRAPAYWTEEQKANDDDTSVLNGIRGRPSTDPLRENPTLSYDPLDPDNSFDPDNSDDTFPQLPYADILMFFTNLPDAKSYVNPNIKSDGPVMLVYGHADIGNLQGNSNTPVHINNAQEPGDTGGAFDNDSFDDWSFINHIPFLTSGQSMWNPPSGASVGRGVQDIAEFWHLARRQILIKNTTDPLDDNTLLPNEWFDRYGHVLSPTDPKANQSVDQLITCSSIGLQGLHAPTHIEDDACANGLFNANEAIEAHYLNWILGGEMDVVAPYGDAVLGGSWSQLQTSQEFDYDFEVENRFFGYPGNAPVAGQPDFNGATDGSRQNVGNFWRGGVPAYWLARSILDPDPPPFMAHRLGHFFLPNCASFKVEWSPNEPRLDKLGLAEQLWIHPFQEPGTTRAGASIYAAGYYAEDSITASNPENPLHLDEFNILAQKTDPDGGATKFLGPTGDHKTYGESGTLVDASGLSPLDAVYRSYLPRFGNSIDAVLGGVNQFQSNVFDVDPTMSNVQASHNTHSWYAKDYSLAAFATVEAPDPLWPRALRITIEMFDEGHRFERPVRHVFVLPIGSKADRKESLN